MNGAPGRPAKSAGNPHLQRLHLLRSFGARLLAGLFFMAVSVLIELAYPKALAYFIDHIDIHKPHGDYGMLAGAVLLALALQALASTLRYYLFESTGQMIVAKIRRLLYGALIRQEIAFYDKHNVGELTSRLSADVEVLHETLTMGLAISLRSLCVFAGCAVMLLIISPVLSLIVLLVVPATLFMGERIGRALRTRAREIQARQADCGKVAHEYFTNIRLVHAFNQQKEALARYLAATDKLLAASMGNTRLMAGFRGVSSFVMYLALVLTLWCGARLIGEGRLSIGELTSFIIYAGMLSSASGAIGDFWGDWMRTIGATERVFEIMDTAAPSEPDGQPALSLAGRIEFAGVDFAYPERPDKPALRAMSFTVGAGEKVALVGASGAGKSTIANLVLGFYPPDRGQILFDARPCTQLSPRAIRSNIAIVEQEPSLFSGSIFDNIAFAVADRQVTPGEVMQAAALANAHDFIMGFPAGYDTIVGERGVQLSGGQKQRVAIARALLRDARILILDEATSALDAASEALVQDALETLMAGRTTIIIAHRFSTIVKADRILVLAQGKIAQQGKHAELMQDAQGVYFSLMESQIAHARGAGERLACA